MLQRRDPIKIALTVTTRLGDVRPVTNFSHVVTLSPGSPFRLHRTLPPIPSRPTSVRPWLDYEIKHDGFRMIVRCDAAGVRLLTRNGHDWADRYPLIADAAGALGVRSCLIDGEAAACDGDGMPVFDRLRYRRQDAAVFLFAFDLLELNGQDLRREPSRVGNVS
jgi:bifunctional non-homologous end joining protein LigD